MKRIINALAGLERGALGVVAGLAALYIGVKYFQRRRLLRSLRDPEFSRPAAGQLHLQFWRR